MPPKRARKRSRSRSPLPSNNRKIQPTADEIIQSLFGKTDGKKDHKKEETIKVSDLKFKEQIVLDDEDEDDVKEIIYQSFRTTKKPSDYSPDEIIYDILKKLKQLDGPISFHLLKPTRKLNEMLGRNGPVMLLLGDAHVGNKGCDKGCNVSKNCYSVYERDDFSFFYKLIEPLKCTTDVFFEWWFKYPFSSKKEITDDDLEQSSHNSGLGESIKEFQQCMKYNKQTGKTQPDCKAKHVRFHMTDTRNVYVEKQFQFAEALEMLLLRRDIDEFKGVIEDYYPNFNWKEIFSLFLKRIELGSQKFFETYFLQHPLFKQHSKIYKQLNALPPSLVSIIQSKYASANQNKDATKQILEQGHPELVKTFYSLVEKYPQKSMLLSNLRKAFIDYFESTTFHVNNKEFKFSLPYEELSEKIHWVDFTSQLDLYFLGRSLKSPKNGLPSQLSVFFAGNNHIKNINAFLLSTGLYECVAHDKADKFVDYLGKSSNIFTQKEADKFISTIRSIPKCITGIHEHRKYHQ